MLKRVLGIGAIVAALAIGLVAGVQAVTISGLNDANREMIFQAAIFRITRETAITAFAGGGQTSAYQLTTGLNRVATVASANDSVKLPVCVGGKVVIVINAAAANSLNVYGQSGETINALSANTAYAIAANKMVIFACALDGSWYTNLTA